MVHRRIGIWVLSMVVLSVGGTKTSAANVVQAESPAEKTRAALNKPISLDFTDARLLDAIDVLREKTQIKFVLVSGNVTEGQRVTIKAKDVAVSKALADMLEPWDLGFAICAGDVVVTSKAEAVDRQMQQPITVDFQKVALKTAIAKIKSLTVSNIVLDDPDGKGSDTAVSLDLNNVAQDRVLALLAEQVGLKAVRSGNVFIVTTTAKAEALREDEVLKAQRVRRKNVLHEKLARKVTTPGFEANTKLKEALEFMSDKYGISILINTEAFKDEMQMPEPENADVKLPKLVGVSLHSCLRLLLGTIGGDFYVEQDYVYVVPKATAIAHQLKQSITLEFEKRPLAEALREIADLTDVTVVIDRAVGDGGDITADLKNVTVESAVRTIALMADLRVVQVDRILFVTTEEKAKKIQADEDKRRKNLEPKEPPVPENAQFDDKGNVIPNKKK